MATTIGYAHLGTDGKLLASESPSSGTADIIKVKASNESVTSSTAIQDDDDLFFSIAANEVWVVNFNIYVTVPAANGVNVAINSPAGSSILINFILTGVATIDSEQTSSINTAVQCAGPVAGGSTFLSGSVNVTNGANAGTVQLRWAQAVSNVSAVTFKAKSFMIAKKAN